MEITSILTLTTSTKILLTFPHYISMYVYSKKAKVKSSQLLLTTCRQCNAICKWSTMDYGLDELFPFVLGRRAGYF